MELQGFDKYCWHRRMTIYCCYCCKGKRQSLESWALAHFECLVQQNWWEQTSKVECNDLWDIVCLQHAVFWCILGQCMCPKRVPPSCQRWFMCHFLLHLCSTDSLYVIQPHHPLMNHCIISSDLYRILKLYRSTINHQKHWFWQKKVIIENWAQTCDCILTFLF